MDLQPSRYRHVVIDEQLVETHGHDVEHSCEQEHVGQFNELENCGLLGQVTLDRMHDSTTNLDRGQHYKRDSTDEQPDHRQPDHETRICREHLPQSTSRALSACFFLSHGLLAPPRKEFMLHAKHIKHLAHYEVDGLVERSGSRVERRHRRNDYGSRLCQ